MLLGKTSPITVKVRQTGIGKDPFGKYRKGFETSFTIKRSKFGMDFMLGVIGAFTLKGKCIELTCPAEFELVIGEDDTPNLLIQSAFKVVKGDDSSFQIGMSPTELLLSEGYFHCFY